MAGEPLDLAIESFLDDNGIPHRTVAVEWKGITELEESVKCLLELIFSQANCSLLLLIGSPMHYLDCITIACMRKAQGWSLVAVLNELRQLQPRRFPIAEQFVEYFDPDLVDFTEHPPEFIAMHHSSLREEERILRRLESQARQAEEFNRQFAPKDADELERERIDALLGKLLFSDKRCILSQGINYDPALSLINDKDDDD